MIEYRMSEDGIERPHYRSSAIALLYLCIALYTVAVGFFGKLSFLPILLLPLCAAGITCAVFMCRPRALYGALPVLSVLGAFGIMIGRQIPWEQALVGALFAADFFVLGFIVAFCIKKRVSMAATVGWSVLFLIAEFLLYVMAVAAFDGFGFGFFSVADWYLAAMKEFGEALGEAFKLLFAENSAQALLVQWKVTEEEFLALQMETFAQIVPLVPAVFGAVLLAVALFFVWFAYRLLKWIPLYRRVLEGKSLILHPIWGCAYLILWSFQFLIAGTSPFEIGWLSLYIGLMPLLGFVGLMALFAQVRDGSGRLRVYVLVALILVGVSVLTVSWFFMLALPALSVAGAWITVLRWVRARKMNHTDRP
jgi:hypothetical protein